jgi:flavodoxin/NAD-dependent dihydropyrimidine dehydrogenase PreA subunit
MIKVLIASFSQTGSTKKIADLIGKGLNSAKSEITHFAISGNEMPDVEAYDMIGIGSPTYIYRPPFVVMDFVNNLEGIKNKATFVFVSYGTHLGDCGNWIRRKLESKGSKDLGYFTSFGRDYWMGYVKRGVMFSPDSPTEEELSSAEKFGNLLTDRYSESKPDVEAYDPPTPAMYGLERMLVARPLAKLMYSKTFRADKNCDGCGICIEKCPVNSLTAKENGHPKWHSSCLLCATCELSCPKDAIHSAFDWAIFAPFMNYNIKKSKKNQIPHASVTHKAGETHLV